MHEPGNEKPHWTPAICVSAVILVVGPLIGFFITANNEGDWLGLGFMGALVLSFGLVGVILFATWLGSVFRVKDAVARQRILLVIVGVFVVYFGSKFLRTLIEYRELLKTQNLSSRLVSDQDFRRQLLRSETLTQTETDAFLSRQVINTLSEDEIQTLWNKRKSGTIINAEHLIEARNAPAAVLRDHYNEVMERVLLREAKPHPRELLNHERLLLHPNLPADVIDEIKGFQISELDKLLSKNLKLKLSPRPELED